jgi:hypothetical protein
VVEALLAGLGAIFDLFRMDFLRRERSCRHGTPNKNTC